MSDYQPMPPTSTPYTGAPVPQTERFNVLSIVGFVLAFVVSLGAVICGHIALAQIKRTGERGRGLAIAALILGYLGILLGIILAIVYVVIIAAAVNSGSFN